MPETPLPPDSESPGGGAPHAPDEQPTTQMPGGGAGTPPPPPRRLLRSRRDRVLGGVCGGIGEYFRVDPLLIRIAAVALAFVGGAAIIAYIAALALVPNDDGTGHPDRERPSRAGTVIGAVLIVMAGIALLDGGWGWHAGWALWGVVPVAIVAGLMALAGQRLLRERGENPTAARLVGAALVVLAIILASAIAAAGSAWATAAGGGGVVAALVIAIGVAMVALSLRHRSARWLAIPALILAIPSGVVAAAGIDVHGGIGERTYRPASTVDLRPQGYRLGTGEMVVDLRDMDWPDGAQLSLKAEVGAGHLLVLVPTDVCVQSKAHVGLGYIDVLGDESGGADVDDERGTLLRRSDHRRLYVDADVGVGAFEVLHSRRDNWDHGDRGSISDALATAGCAGARA